MAFETTTAEVIAGHDLSGKTVLVTGAASGLGLESARVLAGAGAHVVLAVRDQEKADAAMAAIRESVPDASLDAGILDLSSLESVRTFAKWAADKYPRIDVLMNNAGVMACPQAQTVDGFEMQFGTNHLGHFLLTNLLLPSVLAAAPSRIVNLSSAGHHSHDVFWDDPNFETTPYNEWDAYGQSKTANILFSIELDRRLAGKGVHAYAVHPGVIGTNLGRHLTEDSVKDLLDRRKSRPGGDKPMPFKSVEQGAATQVWAAVAPELDAHGGEYLEDTAVSDLRTDYSRSTENAKRLWSMSETFVGQQFPE